MRLIACLLLSLVAFGSHAQSEPDTLYSRVLQPADMQGDFAYLRRLLEETHPGLYRYTSKAVMQAKLDSVAATLTKPLPFRDFYRTVETLIADVRCAHTYAVPVKDFEDRFKKLWKTFPFFMLPIQNRSYVLFNGTTDETIKPGFELLSINGQSMETIRQKLFRYHWADGYIQSSKEAVLKGGVFDLFYYWFIEQPNSFHASFRTLTGDTVQVSVPAQSFNVSLKAYKKNRVNKQMVAWYLGNQPKRPWRIKFLPDSPSTAYLRINEFGGKGANSNESAVGLLQKFMNKSMAQIQKKGVQNLIVDIRSNPGGWDSQGIDLFTYLMKSDSAVAYYTRQHSITDNTESEFMKFSDLSAADRENVKNELIPESDGTFTLKQGDSGRQPRRYAPKPNRFRGRVYFLMNGQSGSTASEFLAIAHANRTGIFVGEESGGAYEGGNGSSFIHLDLPHSKINVGTPLVYYNNAVGEVNPKGRGTLPDYNVPITVDDILRHTDSQLNFVKELIRSQPK